MPGPRTHSSAIGGALTTWEVAPGTARGEVRAPPSKSYTHRELVASFLSREPTRLERPLVAVDTSATRRALQRLGCPVRSAPHAWIVPGAAARRAPIGRVRIDCGSSGTTLRFMAAVSSSTGSWVELTGSKELSSRPIEPLLGVLQEAGAVVRRPARRRSVPLLVRGPIGPVRSEIDVSQSSQFLSALLMVLPTLPGRSHLRLRGRPVSMPYLDATIDVLKRRGVRVVRSDRTVRVQGPQPYSGGTVAVPGDASSAAYLWAAAAISKGQVRVRGIPIDRPQADLRLLEILSSMGARVVRETDGASVRGAGRRAFEADLDDAPDLLPLTAVLAAASDGRSRITGARHAVSKESDRRAASIGLAHAMGARARDRGRSIEIDGRSDPTALRGIRSRDHRVVMSAAVGALAASGPSRLRDGRAVRKSYPRFWHDLLEIGVLARAVRP